jgi:hypothetical protein
MESNPRREWRMLTMPCRFTWASASLRKTKAAGPKKLSEETAERTKMAWFFVHLGVAKACLVPLWSPRALHIGIDEDAAALVVVAHYFGPPPLDGQKD